MISNMFSKERNFALLVVSPAILVLFITTTIPLIYLIVSSFQNINLAMPFLDGFAGFDNYTQMLSDPQFWDSFSLMSIYAVTTVFFQLVIGMGLALMVLQIPTAQWLFRIVAILPIVLAPVVVGLFWRTLMLAPEFGIVDFIVRFFGFESINWLGSPKLALVSVIVIHTWQWTPFSFLILLASLASLPSDLYEAAKLDQANAFKRFWYLTLPLLRPAIVIVIIMRVMIALSAFAAIFAATGGGPGTATEILNLYTYRVSFVELNIGYGSALAVSLLVITMTISIVLFNLRVAQANKKEKAKK